MAGEGKAEPQLYVLAVSAWTKHSRALCSVEHEALTDVMIPYSCQAHKVFQTLMSENFSAECVQPCIGYSCHLFSYRGKDETRWVPAADELLVDTAGAYPSNIHSPSAKAVKPPL